MDNNRLLECGKVAVNEDILAHVRRLTNSCFGIGDKQRV